MRVRSIDIFSQQTPQRLSDADRETLRVFLEKLANGVAILRPLVELLDSLKNKDTETINKHMQEYDKNKSNIWRFIKEIPADLKDKVQRLLADAGAITSARVPK